MIKTINIGGEDVDFKLTLSAFFIFKNQFGYDGLQKLMPVMGEIVESLDTIVADDENPKKKVKDIENDELVELLGQVLQNVYSFELTEVLNFIWAFAKNADNKIPLPEKWYGEFDDFPLYDVLKELLPALFYTLITKKKSTNTKTQKK